MKKLKDDFYKGNSMGILDTVVLVLIMLKLLKVIDMSWFYILSIMAIGTIFNLLMKRYSHKKLIDDLFKGK